MQKNVASDAVIETFKDRSSSFANMSENIQKSYRSETCYEHTGNESVVVVNPILPSEPAVSGDSTGEMDTFVADIMDKSDGGSLQVSEYEVRTTPLSPKRAKLEVPPKKRQGGTVLWEPLLVPSEVDGKVEMITALKRVDSNYISSPKANPKIACAQIVRESNLAAASRMEAQRSSGYTASTKVIVSKGASSTEIKHGVKKEVIKKKVPDVNISEQMEKAIAEREAAILKEIEKAMKEANVRTKSILSDKGIFAKNKSSNEHTKSKSPVKVVPTQNVKKKTMLQPRGPVSIEAEPPKDSSDPIIDLCEDERDSTKLIFSSLNKSVPAMTKMQSVPRTYSNVSSPAVGSVTKEVHGLSRLSTIPAKVVAVTSSGVGPATKEIQSTNKILKVPGTVMVTSSSTAVTVPQNVQTISKVLCGPTVVAPPTSTTVIASGDTRAINKVIAVPVNTKSTPSTLTEISPTPGPRIILLSAPGGGLPLLTPIIPATSIPVIRAPVTTTAVTTSVGLMETRDSARVAENRTRRGKDVSVAIPEINTRVVSTDSVNSDSSGVLVLETRLSGKTSRVGSHRKQTMPQESVTENISSLFQNEQSSIEAKKTMKPNSSQSPLLATTRELKNVSTQNGDKSALTVTSDKSEAVEISEKQGSLAKTNITVNGKATAFAQQTLLQKSVKDPQRLDSYGESMDIDDVSISEELDQGFVDDTRNVISQKLTVSDEVKNSTCAAGNKHHSKEQKSQKTSPKMSVQSKINDVDSSDVALENRLQKMEKLYNEIPPVKSRISLTEEDFSKIKDGFRDSMCAVKAVTASFKSLIRQSPSIRCKELSHSSCQTETIVEDGSSESVRDDRSDTMKSGLILCRLCGGFFQKDSLVSFFGKLSEKKNLLSMLNTILPQIPPVKESDGLPQQICSACVNKLTLCHDIINQFLQADKELRQVLKDEKSCASDSSCLQENRAMPPQESQTSSEEIAPSADSLHLESCELDNCNNANAGTSKEKVNDEKQSSQGEKRTHAVADFESSNSNKATSNHKHKRRRSKSPNRLGSVQTTKSLASSNSSSGGIDLSRLDPEHNVGFEVEWCLDEETIRSSMLPEEDEGPGLNEDATVATVHVSAEGASNAGKVLSAESGIQEHTDISSGTLESHQIRRPQKKTKNCQGNETSKLIDEVSKLSEMHTSVCESFVKSGITQSPVSTVHQENNDIHLNVLTQSPETFKCSSCPLSFHSKKEVFSHKIMQHKEDQEGAPKMPVGKQDSGSVVKPKKLPQKQTGSPDSNTEIESCEDPVMCDQCGLPFPNEYSLHLHKCVIHETAVNPQLIIKDTKELEYKIAYCKEAIEENEACQEIPVASLTDGKILVKCGNGMLWVNCSKVLSEEQMAMVQPSDLSEITYTNVENDTVNYVSSDQSISNVVVSPQNVTKIQFAFKCDHCKQIFRGKPELLTHMQTHLTEEYSCNECGVKFHTMKALNNHIPSHIPLDRVCDECGLILLDSKKLVQHRKEHTHNFPHVCESCGKRFPNEQTLEVHETVHYSKKGPLACSLCRKCFFFKHSLVRHRSQHASNRLQKCSLCFRVLNSSDQLRKHVALHHLMKNFVCFCKQTFPSQKELVEHRYLKHSYAEIFCARNKIEITEPLPLHQCSVCLRVLNSKQSLLKHHVTSHSSTWPFYCIQCSRKYTSMFHLARHECHRKNTSAFQCRICGKAFQNKNIFKQHKVIHNNRKWRYICRHCGKAFQKSQSLVSHIMTHGGKKFLCPRCHQPCQDKEGLLKHYNNGSCQLKVKSLQ